MHGSMSIKRTGFCNRDTGCDFRLLPRSKWDLGSSGLLRGVSC